MGIAISEGKFAIPRKVIRYSSEKKLFEEIKKLVAIEGIESIVVGISEGQIGEESEDFAKRLESNLSVPVVFQDETLSTYEAKIKSIEAGIKRIKRRSFVE